MQQLVKKHQNHAYEEEGEEDKTEEDPKVKRMVEEKGITQEDLDALTGLLQAV